MKKYNVTEKAGEFVAGRRKPENGEPLELSDEAAKYPLMLGEIELIAAPAKPVAETKPKKD